MEIKPYIRKPQYYETDQMGIIHHANYIRWFEEVRVDYMEQMGYGYEKSMKSGIDFAVLSVSCEYKSMVRFGETVAIWMEITELTPVRLTIQYKITDMKTGTLRSTGESKHCYYDGFKKRPTSLKRVLPELYELFASLVKKDE